MDAAAADSNLNETANCNLNDATNDAPGVNDTANELDIVNDARCIDDLPDEILVMILEQVDLIGYSSMSGGSSTLTKLWQCAACGVNNRNCIHLHTAELKGIRNLALVCKRWKNILQGYRYIYFPGFGDYTSGTVTPSATQ